MLGVVTEVTVRILKKPESVRAVLIGFDTIEDSGNCVADIIARGIVPAGMEIMDKPLIIATDNYAKAGYPRDVEALLISDLNSEHPLFIGSLLARDAVKIKIDADNLVSRHVSIFGMSGSGKTVMVRRIMDELLKKKYPIDPLQAHHLLKSQVSCLTLHFFYFL